MELSCKLNYAPPRLRGEQGLERAGGKGRWRNQGGGISWLSKLCKVSVKWARHIQGQPKPKLQCVGSLHPKSLKRRSLISVLRAGSALLSLGLSDQEGDCGADSCHPQGCWLGGGGRESPFQRAKSFPKGVFGAGKDTDRLFSSVLSCVHFTSRLSITH